MIITLGPLSIPVVVSVAIRVWPVILLAELSGLSQALEVSRNPRITEMAKIVTLYTKKMSFDAVAQALGVCEPKLVLGRTLSKLAEQWRRNSPAVLARPLPLVIPDEGLSKRSDVADGSIAKQYMDLVRAGIRPAIVLESRVTDKADLMDRGIKDLVKAPVH